LPKTKSRQYRSARAGAGMTDLIGFRAGPG
jgi:hypothetical protein